MPNRRLVQADVSRSTVPFDRFRGKREMSRYYVQGADAARKGSPLRSNPYAAETPAHEDWRDGFRDYEACCRPDA